MAKCSYCERKVSDLRAHFSEAHPRSLACHHPACSGKKRRYRHQSDIDKHTSMTTKHFIWSRATTELPEVCQFCSAKCKNEQNLRRHLRKIHNKDTDILKTSKDEELLRYYYDKVIPSSEDRKESKKLAREMVENLLKKVSEIEGYCVYNGPLESAGSTSTNTKTNISDEFDFDLHLIIGEFTLIKSSLGYKFVSPDGTDSLEVPKIAEENRTLERLPDGFIQIKASSAPERLRVEEYLAPRRIHEDLYSKLKEHVWKIEGLSIKRMVNGPALKLTYQKKERHSIDIDLSPSLYTKEVKVNDEVWRRSFFHQNSEVLKKVRGEPVLLIPKKENCWLISYEKIMKVMINSIDGPGTCRKICHKILKYDTMKWKSETEESYKGISTILFKHHLLWFNDRHPDNHYWSSKNLSICYKDMLVDLESKLRKGCIPNYFYSATNLLEGKDQNVIRRFADRLKRRAREF